PDKVDISPIPTGVPVQLEETRIEKAKPVKIEELQIARGTKIGEGKFTPSDFEPLPGQTQSDLSQAAPTMLATPSRMPTDFEAQNAPKAVVIDPLNQAIQSALPNEPTYMAPPPTEPIMQPA